MRLRARGVVTTLLRRPENASGRMQWNEGRAPLPPPVVLTRRPPVSRYFAVGTLAAALLATSWALARPAPAPAEPPFHALLKKTAGEYLAYGRVDDEMRWAPFLCRMPQPATAHVSASK